MLRREAGVVMLAREACFAQDRLGLPRSRAIDMLIIVRFVGMRWVVVV